MSQQTPRNTERVTFPSSNALGMPDLLPGMLSDAVPSETTPVILFRTIGIRKETATDSIIAFFLDDYRFISSWSYPARLASTLIEAQIEAAIEPDFSLWHDAPRIEQMHAVYRTRWVGRYWQEQGIPVIPCLQWSDEESFNWAWLGIPQGVPVAAVESRVCGKSHTEFNEGLAAACETVRPETLLIYGTQKDWVRVPHGVNPVWVEPAMNRRFARLKEKRWAANAAAQ